MEYVVTRWSIGSAPFAFVAGLASFGVFVWQPPVASTDSFYCRASTESAVDSTLAQSGKVRAAIAAIPVALPAAPKPKLSHANRTSTGAASIAFVRCAKATI